MRMWPPSASTTAWRRALKLAVWIFAWHRFNHHSIASWIPWNQSYNSLQYRPLHLACEQLFSWRRHSRHINVSATSWRCCKFEVRDNRFEMINVLFWEIWMSVGVGSGCWGGPCCKCPWLLGFMPLFLNVSALISQWWLDVGTCPHYNLISYMCMRYLLLLLLFITFFWVGSMLQGGLINEDKFQIRMIINHSKHLFCISLAGGSIPCQHLELLLRGLELNM